MRIMTRTQYDAIVDIVTEQKKRIAELEADLEKRKKQVEDLEETIRKKNDAFEYVNDKLFERTRQCIELQKAATTPSVTVDYPNSAAYFH